MEDRTPDTHLPVSGDAADARFPAAVRDAFPMLEPASAADSALVVSQLGKPYQGEIFVARRCPFSRPAVVLTVPLEGAGGPVPPLLWLTCPRASSLVGTLESTGAMRRMEERLDSDARVAEAFMDDERRFAELQENIARAMSGETLARRLGARGVAGGREGAIKCLHAHLAYRLSIGTGKVADDGVPGEGRQHAVPGLWCEEMLEEEGGVWCERPPAACVI